MAKLTYSDITLCHDGSLEGFLTLVFKAYAMHVVPAQITSKEYVQPALGQAVVDVEVDLALAERVRIGICNHAGYKAYNTIERAFLSCVEGRETDIFSYVVKAMDGGRRAVSDPSDPVVCNVERLAQKVTNEMEDIRQFVRFQELENGVFFSRVNPKADLLPLAMDYFVERFNTQPFLIYDEVHHLAAVYDLQKKFFVRTDDLNLPTLAVGETEYQRLWKTFYDALSNEQRFNPGLRCNLMPKRFWKNLTEMQLF